MSKTKTAPMDDKWLSELRERVGGPVAVSVGCNEVEALIARLDNRQAIVDKLDKTADNVPITPGMPLWCAFRRGIAKGKAVGGGGIRVRVEYDEPIDLTDGGGAMADESDPALRVCYSTPELAQEAFDAVTHSAI